MLFHLLDLFLLSLLAATLVYARRLGRALHGLRADHAALLPALEALKPALAAAQAEAAELSATARAGMLDAAGALRREVAAADEMVRDLRDLVPRADQVLDRVQAIVRAGLPVARPAPSPASSQACSQASNQASRPAPQPAYPPPTKSAVRGSGRLRSLAERELAQALGAIATVQ
jgi:hypothetical protein